MSETTPSDAEAAVGNCAHLAGDLTPELRAGRPTGWSKCSRCGQRVKVEATGSMPAVRVEVDG